VVVENVTVEIYGGFTVGLDCEKVVLLEMHTPFHIQVLSGRELIQGEILYRERQMRELL
jgi:hypothetical protein